MVSKVKKPAVGVLCAGRVAREIGYRDPNGLGC
jgi:hypothetical protein